MKTIRSKMNSFLAMEKEKSPPRNPAADPARTIGIRWSECAERSENPCTPEELRNALERENMRLYQMLYV